MLLLGTVWKHPGTEFACFEQTPLLSSVEVRIQEQTFLKKPKKALLQLRFG